MNPRQIAKLYLTRSALKHMLEELEEEIIHEYSLLIIKLGGASIFLLYLIGWTVTAH